MSNLLPQDTSAANGAATIGTPETAPQADADRRHLLDRQEAVVAMGRRAIAAPDLSTLMQDAASLIAEMLGAEHHCVAELAADRSRIVHTLNLKGLHRAKPRVFVRESGTQGTDSLAGYALEVAHPVVVEDLAGDTRFSDPLLQEHGIRSAIAVPLQLQQQSFGALSACSSQRQRFDTQDTLFVETVAHLITTTIGRVRVEQTLAAERRLATGVLQAVNAMVLVLNDEGRIVRSNHACEKITGFSRDEIQDRPMADVFLLPGEADWFQSIINKLDQGGSPIEYESSLLTKDAERRQVNWSCAAVSGPEGSIESIVATGIDVTAQRQAGQLAAKAGQDAASAMSQAPTSPSAPSQDRSGSSHGKPGPLPAEDPTGVAELPGPIDKDRRRRRRLSYPYRQFIAPMVDGKLPAKDTFTEVQCNDIAPGGFSFLASRPPQCEMLVVGLGTPPKLTYLTAQVAHVTRIEREGQRMYLVGCSYVGRVAY